MPNRTLCAVLEELRTCTKTLNFSYMLALIEEIQSMGNRMESALWDQHEIKDLRAEIKSLTKERDKLKVEVKGEET